MTSAVHTLTEDEAHKLLQFLKNNHKTARQNRTCVRNYVLAAVMLESGLRVGEVVQLTVNHLWYLNHPVVNLVVTSDIAKNRIKREIPVSVFLRNAINFLQQDFWSDQIFDSSNNAFSLGPNGKPLSTRQVERILAFAGMKSLSRPVNPHMLRHTFATRLSRVTSIRIVQLLLGHSNLSSTQVYTHPNSVDLQEAIKAVSSGKQYDESENPLANVSVSEPTLPPQRS